ncbi:MAG: HAMP domain-containing protein [Inquilinus sp.]|nr:HAMP domain-containing protein [Inquilinus sp.]
MRLETRSGLRAPTDLASRAGSGEGARSGAAAPRTGWSRPVGRGDAPPPVESRAPSRQRRIFSKLTARVLAINLLALMILVGGLLYLGRYEERLIQAEMESLRTEALIFAGALAEGAIVGDPDIRLDLDPERGRQMVRRLYETTDTRTRLFATDGSLLADSRLLIGGGVIEIELLRPADDNVWLRDVFDEIYGWITQQVPERKGWPAYAERPLQTATDYPLVMRALSGNIGQQIWSVPGGGKILGVAVPVQRLRAVMGAILVTRDTAKLEKAIQSVREDILKVYGVALLVTVALSLYLAGTITRPIRRLAAAAEQVRRGHGRQQLIPDLTRRRDEIGELSGALRDMTSALWARMDAIENFAADVAHEIKNPLTSLRSAVETVSRIKDADQQRRLMTIILEDVQRLDRLITDISDASRLDAELSRAEAEEVDIAAMLRMLVELYETTLEDGGPVLKLSLPPINVLYVNGLEDRLVQVFRNLIGNAISFSPPGGTIAIKAWRENGVVAVSIADEGPGIPESKVAAIFDRFYTERPAGEKFGTHSGLGLSISKQIVDAHHGQIFAANRRDRSGARFTVRIPAR